MYDGGSYTYAELFEFINIYSETFVDVSSQKQEEVKSAATKMWLNMATPYLASDSANDICLKRDGTLCVIYVAPNMDKSAEVDEIFRKVQANFQSKIERGISFNFMRLHTEHEPALAELFKGDNASNEPFVVVMNPGKRKKFLRHEGSALDAEAISGTLDKILGGDARFKAVKGNELPELMSKYEVYTQ